MTPYTWVILSDKGGDNSQVQTIVDALGWPVQYKHLCMQPKWVLGKPRYRPSLAHLDLEKSDALQAPWPDLIITAGRRPSMAALWVRKQSGGHSKIVLVGKPSGYMREFSLMVASAENQMPPLPNFHPTRLPLMRVDAAEAEGAAQHWRERFAALPKPLIAILVGGKTNPFLMNRKVARQLLAEARRIIEEQGGTPYITTSRRTGPEVVQVLREELPPGAQLFEWSAGAEDNPYRALMVEVIYLHKPLAIFPLPCGWWGSLDQGRRALAHRLFKPRRKNRWDELRHLIARGVYYIDYFKLLCATRDFRAFHRMLVQSKLAVWARGDFQREKVPLPDDVGAVVRRIKKLFEP